MKKVFSCLLVVLMLASLLAVGVGAMVGPEYDDYGTIANVARKSIRLDGVKEDVYDDADPIAIATLVDATKVSDVTGTAYMVYDSQYIWVYVDVNDTTLATKAPSPLEAKYTEDSVEIIIDWTNEGKNVANETPYQSRLSHEGYISARLGQQGVTMQGTEEEGSTNPVNWLKGYGEKKADGSGYVCEFRIEIPDDKYDIGERITVGFMINDYDATGATSSRVMITSSANPEANQWAVAKMGSIAFDYAPYTADTTIIYVAIAMVAALALGTVVLVSLKKKAK